MDVTFPFYKVEGNPYEVGFQYGRLASERIQKSLDIYRQAFWKWLISNGTKP